MTMQDTTNCTAYCKSFTRQICRGYLCLQQLCQSSYYVLLWVQTSIEGNNITLEDISLTSENTGETKTEDQKELQFARTHQQLNQIITIRKKQRGSVIILNLRPYSFLYPTIDINNTDNLFYIMSNRWGRVVQSRPSTKTGQNNINININFNAQKEKNTAFTGKKIDNFIEVNNSPRNNVNRPNVSMETLKQKKKKPASVNQPNRADGNMQRKKSKSKIVVELETPEKNRHDCLGSGQKSLNKKSTLRRNSRSRQKYMHQFSKKSPYSQSRSYQNSNSHSKSKSRSRSQSAKKYLKNPSTKISNQAKRFVKNQDKKVDKNNNTISIKKSEKEPKIQKSKPLKNQESVMKRKKSEDYLGKKKVVEQIKKTGVQTAKSKSRKVSQSTKSLKPLPLVVVDDESFDQDASYKKIQKQAKQLLYQDKPKTKAPLFKNQDQTSAHKKSKKRETIVMRYMAQAHTYQDMKKLTEVAITIQRFWRGYRVRTQFINEINLMHHKIQMSRKKMQGAEFWDGASDSILHAQDPPSQHQFSNKNQQSESESQRPISISQASSLSKKRSTMNKMGQQQVSNEILERINKLQRELQEQQAKSKKLEEQNNNLKQNLEKISVMQSGNPSIQSSMKQSAVDSWEEVKPDQQKQEIKEEDGVNFQLRLPKRINKKEPKQQQNQQPTHQQNQEPEDKMKQYREKLGVFECSSPKNISFSIDASLQELLSKKQFQVKQNFQKKASMYQRMYHDKLFSPRTYSFKRDELEQTMKRQTQQIKARFEQFERVSKYLRQNKTGLPQQKEEAIEKKVSQISHQNQNSEKKQINQLSQIKKVEDNYEIKEQLPKNHVVEDYENVNLHSHRSMESGSEELDIDQELNSNQGINRNQASFDPFLNQQQHQIQSENSNAIRIFRQVSEEIKDHEENQQFAPSSQSENENNSNIINPDQEVVQIARPKGIETTLMFIKEYCVAFVEFIKGSEHLTTFVEGLCSQIEYDMSEFLKSYRNTTSSDYNNNFNSHDVEYIYPYFKMIFPRSQVITRQAFNDFNENYEKLQGQCHFPTERDFFLNSLLDAFNESLDYQRPGSIYGKPPAWISEHRTLKNNALNTSDINQRQEIIASPKFDEACGVSIARIIQWATCLCGFIPQSPEMGDVQIGEQQINQIHESRMALMLEKDLLQNQESILDSQIEQTQVKLYMGQVIFNELIQEFINESDFFK